MVPVVDPRRRLRAPRLRRKPSCSMAAMTRSAVSGCTAGSSLTTRETVLMLTPASLATSLIVARLLAVRMLPSRSRPGGDNVVIVTGIERHAPGLVNACRVDCADSATGDVRQTADHAVRKWTGLDHTLDCLVSRCPRWPGSTDCATR